MAEAANSFNSSSRKLETESLEKKLSTEFKSNSFAKQSETYSPNQNQNQNQNLINSLKPDCDEANDGVHGVQKIIPLPNDPSLNFIPKSYTNYPNNLDLHKNSQKLYKEMAQISKDVFDSLLSKELNNRKKTNFIKANLGEGPKTGDEFLKYMKEFIPNFEFPQFIKSDLEQSINDIKREKLLLWLRGFSLNDHISKIHLPIYENLSFTNEDQIRKLFLDKFYKDIVKDKNANVNSLIYRNMLGNYEKIVPKGDLAKYVGMKPQDIIKDMKVVDSKFIDKKDLIGLVKQSNMRFKEKDEKTNNSDSSFDVIGKMKDNFKQNSLLETKENNIITNESSNKGQNLGKSGNKMKSLKDITNDLKAFVNKME